MQYSKNKLNTLTKGCLKQFTGVLVSHLINNTNLIIIDEVTRMQYRNKLPLKIIILKLIR